jgi:signal transduction histidine kinase
MRVIASLRRRNVELAWGFFAAANLVAMALWPSWETIPFHFVWISLTLLYGFRVWGATATTGVLFVVIVATGSLILYDAFAGIQLWGELFEVPLMSAMFLAMVWHARRRQDALRTAERHAKEMTSLLARQERFLHDASHELRTPVTIARGHLEVLNRLDGTVSPEVTIALDELQRIERIIDRLLLLAKADQRDFLATEQVELEPFLEDVFIRWTEVAPRLWHLGPIVRGTLAADSEALRIALDALLENAVKYTEEGDAIELRARAFGAGVAIEVADEGSGIAPDAAARIFDRFARGDVARTRAQGGVGLGLAIADAIAKAHRGSCAVAPNGADGGWVTTFALRLPSFRAALAEPEAEAGVSPATSRA